MKLFAKNPLALTVRLLLLLTIGFIPNLADAAILMNASDTSGQTSFNAGTHWTGGAAPVAGNTYDTTAAFLIRTPSGGATPITFAGDSLTLTGPGSTAAGGGRLDFTGAAGGTITVNNLITTNLAMLQHGGTGGSTFVLAGGLTIKADASNGGTNGCIFLTGNGPIFVTASISGSGAICLGTPSAGNNGNNVILGGSLSGFTGKIITTDHHVTCPLTVSNTTDQVLSGSIGLLDLLTKQGPGKLTLAGSNTFSGGFTLNGAIAGSQININTTNALGATASTFTISGGNNGALDNTSGAALTNLNNNPQLWSSDFTFVGTTNLDLGSGSVTLGGTRTVTVSSNVLTVDGIIAGTAAGLIKSGLGSLILTATNSFTGNTTVSAGSLGLGTTGSITNSTNIVVSSGAKLDVTATSFILASYQTLGGSGLISGSVTNSNGTQILPGGSGTIGNLTISSNLALAGGDTVKFDFNATSNDVVVVGGDLKPGGTATTLNVASLPTGGLANGDYVLFRVSGNLIGSPANYTLTGAPSPSRQTFAVTYDTVSAPKRVLLHVTGAAANLTWNPTGTAWDIVTTTNWLNGAANDFYFDGDSVSFTDAGSSLSPVLNASVTPASVVFKSANAYVLSGTGKITGGTGLTKTNTGMLTIFTPTNDFSGGTYIGGGTVSVTNLANSGSASPIGTGSLVLDGGTLQYGGPTASINRGATLNGGGGALAVTNPAATLLLSGALVGTNGGGFTKTGNGTLTFAGANVFDGFTTITAGTLQLTNSGAVGAGSVTNNGAIWFSGNFAVTNSIAGTGNLTNDAAGTLTLAGTNSYSGATIINGPNFGGLIVANSNALGNTPLVTVISTTGGASGGTRVTLNPGVGTPVGTTLSLPTIGTTVRSALVAAGPSSWNGPITLNGDGTASPGDQIAFIGNAGGLTIGGNVTGVNFPGSLQLRGGTGFINGTINLGTSATLQVNDGVTWTINSIGNTWGLSQLASGVLQLGANNALPTTTTVNFGAAGNGTLDLNGFNQQVAALVIAGGSDLITNSSATADATLTVATNGGASTFSGAIVDGVHKVAVKLAGSTVLTLTASNSYSGNTTISGGKLALSGAGSIGSSATIAVGSGTTLDVSAATPTFTLGASQTLSGTGTNGSIVGSVILNNGALALNYTNGFATLIVTNGVFTLNNNNVTVTVLGTALPAGSYKLVAISPSGSVAGSVGSSIVTVNGAGVAAGALTTLKIAGGELYLVVNHAPVASLLNVSRYAGLSFKLALSDLATNWSDAEGDPISFVSVGSSTNSIAVSTNGGYVLYPNAANVNDQFSYTIVDAQGATATGLVNLLISTNSTGQINSFTATGGTAAMTFAGIPGYAYDVQRSTDLVNWSTILTTNAPANGRFQFVDASAPQPAAYYRLSWNP